MLRAAVEQDPRRGTHGSHGSAIEVVTRGRRRLQAAWSATGQHCASMWRLGTRPTTWRWFAAGDGGRVQAGNACEALLAEADHDLRDQSPRAVSRRTEALRRMSFLPMPPFSNLQACDRSARPLARPSMRGKHNFTMYPCHASLCYHHERFLMVVVDAVERKCRLAAQLRPLPGSRKLAGPGRCVMDSTNLVSHGDARLSRR